MKTFQHKSARRRNAPTREVVQTSRPDAAKGKAHRFDVRDRGSVPALAWQREEGRKTIHAPLLTISEKIDPAAWLGSLKRHSDPPKLWEGYDGFSDPDRAHFEWYEHSGLWHNRLVHADAKRAMASLLEHEHMAGSVQCVYFDPPYGMDFDAAFVDDALQVTAFRDTYERGIHTYLDGLRQTVALAWELLADAGSLFLQIGDINVHRVALVLDEVFGAENRVSTITYNTTGGGR